MTRYPIKCPYCPTVVDSGDSMSDSRVDLDSHLLRKHPDLPDPTHDPRFPAAPGGTGPDETPASGG